MFFPNSKFEFVYYEAIANAIDANATKIVIRNRLESLKDSSSIEVEISDNGDGFTDDRFAKFSKLLDVESDDHKGIGRLVFLNYFNNVHVKSAFGGKKRAFLFSESFVGKCEISATKDGENQTTLLFTHYNKERLKSYDRISPTTLKESITRHFFPLLYEKKLKNQPLEIVIHLDVENPESTDALPISVAKVDVSSLDDLKKAEFPAEGLDLLSNLEILYSVKQVDGPGSIITAACSDGRSIPLSLLSKSQLPQGYDLIFVVYSDFFTGKSDSSRQSLAVTEYELETLKSILVEKLSEVLRSSIPKIKEHNERAVANFTERYPHLNGYFNKNAVGLIEAGKVIEDAQKKFFLAQREILEATNLDEAKYEKSIEISSRLLMEYILYRTLIIRKLKQMDGGCSEADIHNTIVPMKKILRKGNIEEQFFFNNAWLLDDRYMNFSSILSDVEMAKLAEELKIEDEELTNEKRPDLTVVFSSDINASEKVDVVVVELKKLELPLAKREEVVSQLRQRARKLLLHYPDKIQRIWFYGIVDFNQEFVTALIEDKFIPLYSGGHLYYKEYEILPDSNDHSHKVPAGIFVLDYEAFINDAESRNSTFLKILKSRFVQDGSTSMLELTEKSAVSADSG
jgi:hypothetical protein